ncbi:hypothetical protein SAMN05421776_1178 [Nocardia farcinica]|uniref:Uncharacterized protein n=1 Tax=Nocardia farcinica TaxID=37329 RepID=A0A0H5NWK2_NOCFR|nr:hypothetical protein [Nocardia farcinica]PFW99015.1 hypothetical protein CJ469_05615 [Nocardia farcinica]PFX06053.1 hypothetical protein CJ468_04913 [Nocardia farcinica]CRY79857.1 Uncharacterised protein [Nocardia farcinica]SIT33569.1 hypothetical protein SAMN05421776_1178 [Nocardia farcinica]
METKASMANAVVTLPPVEVDQDGFKYFDAGEGRWDRCRVVVRKSDNRLALDGIPSILGSPEEARAVAAALLAGAKYLETRGDAVG